MTPDPPPADKPPQPTARDDALAAGDLAADALAGTTDLVHRMHKAISNRVFDAIGRDAAPTRAAHDAIADGVYESVGRLQSILPRVAGAVAAEQIDPATPSVTTTPKGAAVVAAANGLAGDRLAGRHPALRHDLTLRVDGAAVPPTAEAVAAAFPTATGRMVVFVHGWSVDERCWWWRPAEREGVEREGAEREGAERGGAERELPDPDIALPYGDRLARDLGTTPLYVRYNTGLHISDNGAMLADVLEALVAVWPVAVESVALVGYSMGGLVARSACHHAEEAGHAWFGRVGAVVCLGTPHLGAPLEQGAHVLGWALAQFPETAALGGLVDGRSAGVKDLRYGAVTPDHWSVGDAEELLVDRVAKAGPGGTRQEVYLLGSRLAAADSPASRVLGDLLVPVASATATARSGRRSIPVVQDGIEHITGVTHLGLLNDPAVYAALRRWLAPPA